MLRILTPVKIQRLRPGLNPKTWVPEANMLTTRPPKLSVSALHVSGGISARNQDLMKLYVQSCVLSCFTAVYGWCRWVGTVQLMLMECTDLTMGGKTARNM